MSARRCRKHGKPFPCGPCRIENSKRPPQAAPQPAVTDEQVETAKAFLLRQPEPEFGNESSPPEGVLVHSCVHGGMKRCRCKKRITPAEAEKKVRVGEADWAMRVPARGSAYRLKSEIVLRHFGHDAVPYADAVDVSPNGLVRVVTTWPEFEDLALDNDEWIVWSNATEADRRIPLPELVAEMAEELGRPAAELSQLYESAAKKIQARYDACRRYKVGIFASEKNLPPEFDSLPVERIEGTMGIRRSLLSTEEFFRLDQEEREAVSAWVNARLNYADAAHKTEIAESTLKDRVKRGLANLRKLAASGTVSGEFGGIAEGLFGADGKLEPDADAQDKNIIRSEGGSIGGVVVSGGMNLPSKEGGSQRWLTKRPKSFEGSGVGVLRKPGGHETPDTSQETVEDDYSEESTA